MKLFLFSQFGVIGVVAGVLAVFLIVRLNRDDSQFARGAGRSKPSDAKSLGKSQTEKRKPPLQLPGIEPGAAPHVILGIPPDATRAQIEKAFRTRMKHYHPDRLAKFFGPNFGKPEFGDSPEWKKAQAIAEAINRARAEMLRALRS